MAEDPRAHHGEVPGAVCGAQEVTRGQGGALPVQEHLSTGRWDSVTAYLNHV